MYLFFKTYCKEYSTRIDASISDLDLEDFNKIGAYLYLHYSVLSYIVRIRLYEPAISTLITSSSWRNNYLLSGNQYKFSLSYSIDKNCADNPFVYRFSNNLIAVVTKFPTDESLLDQTEFDTLGEEEYFIQYVNRLKPSQTDSFMNIPDKKTVISKKHKKKLHKKYKISMKIIPDTGKTSISRQPVPVKKKYIPHSVYWSASHPMGGGSFTPK